MSVNMDVSNPHIQYFSFFFLASSLNLIIHALNLVLLSVINKI